MKTRTPDLLGMSYACANMVHCPGYADDLRQYTTLNKHHQVKGKEISLAPEILTQDFQIQQSEVINCEEV